MNEYISLYTLFWSTKCADKWNCQRDECATQATRDALEYYNKIVQERVRFCSEMDCPQWATKQDCMDRFEYKVQTSQHQEPETLKKQMD